MIFHAYFSLLFVSSFSYFCRFETGLVKKAIWILIFLICIVNISLWCFPPLFKSVCIGFYFTCMRVNIFLLPCKHEEIIVHDLFTVDAALSSDFTIDLADLFMHFHDNFGTFSLPFCLLEHPMWIKLNRKAHDIHHWFPMIE